MSQPQEQSTNWKEVSWQHILRSIAQHKDQAPAPTDLPTQEHMVKAMHSYIDIINGKQPEGAQSLFADNFTLEDPIGTKLWSIIKEYPTDFMEEEGVKFTPLRAELVSPVSTTYSNQAAMAFKLYMNVGGQEISIDIVDVMTFDEAGKIVAVQAYWGRANVTVLEKEGPND
jgi:steroid delta-isomerase